MLEADETVQVDVRLLFARQVDVAAEAQRAGFTRARGWVLARINRIKNVFAVLLGAMGVAILTGADKWLEARVNALLPEGWLNLTVLF